MLSTGDVYKYYSKLIEVIDFKKTDIVLKTDCYNEAAGRPLVPSISQKVARVDVVEIDREIIVKAFNNLLFDNVKIINNDLLNINGRYDKILDFSTIDHIRDYKILIKKYSEMLNPNGTILIIAWTTEGRSIYGVQSFFNFNEIDEEIKKYFIIKRKLLFVHPANNERKLYEWLGNI